MYVLLQRPLILTWIYAASSLSRDQDREGTRTLEHPKYFSAAAIYQREVYLSEQLKLLNKH